MDDLATVDREAFAPDPEKPRLYALSTLLADWEADAAAAHGAYESKTPRGPVTGLASLDQEIGGALGHGLHITHGAPGSGKSAFILQVAASCGVPALLVTCEMAPLELLRRHSARVTGTFLGRFKTGELDVQTSLELAKRAVEAAPHLVIADATRAHPDLDWLRTAATATRQGSERFLLAVDSVHSWAEGIKELGTEYERLNFAIAALQLLARELGCPILAVAERNRSSMQSGGQSAAAGTRRFEYSGETVLELQREKDSQPDAKGEMDVKLTISKNRNGAAGKRLALKFHGALQRFSEA